MSGIGAQHVLRLSKFTREPFVVLSPQNGRRNAAEETLVQLNSSTIANQHFSNHCIAGNRQLKIETIIMQKWIISANSKIYNHAAVFDKYGYIDWTQKVKYSVGDEVYIYCTKPYKRIMYKTKVIAVGMTCDKITDDKEFWHDLEKYKKERFGIFVRLKFIERSDNINLTLEKLCANGLKAAPQGPVKMKKELADYVNIYFSDTLDSYSLGEEEIPQNCYEGAKYSILVNKYERSSIARMKCIEKYGCKCSVCGFDFEKEYGELGKGFIHIHHIVPIARIGKEYKIDYEKDLVPVCPNCHAMLHRKLHGNNITVDVLKNLLHIKR